MGKDWNGRKDGDPEGGSQKAKVVEKMSCPEAAVLHIGDRHSPASLKENVEAAMAFMVDKTDKKAQPHITESLATGTPVFLRNTKPRVYTLKAPENEKDADKTRRLERQMDLKIKAQADAHENMDEYYDQCLRGRQVLTGMSTTDTLQGMQNEALLYAKMMAAVGPETLLQF